MTVAAYNLFEKEYPSIIKKEGTDLKIEKMMRYEGPGTTPIKTEGSTADQARLYESNIETFAQDSYVFEMPVTWEQQTFAVTNARFINQIGQYQARSMQLRYEFLAASVLSNGFTAGATAGGDGLAYFSAAHTFKQGGTYDNLLTSAVLSKTSLEAALKEIANAKMENSIPAALKVKEVIIGYENILVLPELLKSTLDPDTANNTYNAIQDFSLTKNLNHYVTDTNDWFCDTNVNTRTMFEASAPRFYSYLQDETQNLVEAGWSSIAVGFHDQLGTFGNEGGS